MDIVKLHQAKLEMIAEKYYTKFTNEIHYKNEINVQQFLLENEKLLSEEFLSATINACHQSILDDEDLFPLLKQNGDKSLEQFKSKVKETITE